MKARPLYKLLLSLAVIFSLACGEKSDGLIATATDTATQEIEYLVTLFTDAVGITMTNAAVAGTEINTNLSRLNIDLTPVRKIRLHFASSLTSATIQCRLEYSLDTGSTWTTLIPNERAGTTANQNNTSDWIDVPGAATREVLLRAVIVGDGVLDPVIRYVRFGYK